MAHTPTYTPQLNREVKYCVQRKVAEHPTCVQRFPTRTTGAALKQRHTNNLHIWPPKTSLTGCFAGALQKAINAQISSVTSVSKSFQMTQTGAELDQICQPQASQLPLCLSLLSNKFHSLPQVARA